MGVLHSDSHSINNPYCKNLSIISLIPFLSSILKGYYLTLMGFSPGFNLIIIKVTFLALPGTSVAQTPGHIDL